MQLEGYGRCIAATDFSYRYIHDMELVKWPKACLRWWTCSWAAKAWLAELWCGIMHSVHSSTADRQRSGNQGLQLRQRTCSKSDLHHVFIIQVNCNDCDEAYNIRATIVICTGEGELSSSSTEASARGNQARIRVGDGQRKRKGFARERAARRRSTVPLPSRLNSCPAACLRVSTGLARQASHQSHLKRELQLARIVSSVRHRSASGKLLREK
jgi:hypothetical protein